MANVGSVVKAQSCVGCGGCAVVCPAQCISISFDTRRGFHTVAVKDDQCTDCGLCMRICPGHYYQRWTSSEEASKQLAGEFKTIKLAASSDEWMRISSSSGGIAGVVVRSLLEDGLVDCVLMTKSLHCEPFASTTILRSANEIEDPGEYSSRYVSHPIVLGLRGLEDERIAVVGLPCQVHALRSIGEELGVDYFIIGLACGGGFSTKATLQIARESLIESIDRVYYRGGGWPGRFRMEGKDSLGRAAMYEEQYYGGRFSQILYSYLFMNPACWYCRDHFSDEADISLFDFWDDSVLGTETLGATGTIVRSERGLEVLNHMLSKGRVRVLRELTLQEVLACQMRSLLLKKIRGNNSVSGNCSALLLGVAIALLTKLNVSNRTYPRIVVTLAAKIMGRLTTRARYRRLCE